MTMEITWLEFQLSTDNQFFDLIFFSEIYLLMFSGSASLLALSVFMWDRKRGSGGHFGFIIF